MVDEKDNALTADYGKNTQLVNGDDDGIVVNLNENGGGLKVVYDSNTRGGGLSPAESPSMSPSAAPEAPSLDNGGHRECATPANTDKEVIYQFLLLFMHRIFYNDIFSLKK